MSPLRPRHRSFSILACLCAAIAIGSFSRASAQVDVAGGESNPTLRTVAIPGSSIKVRTWTQATESGDIPYASISANGTTFTEPRPADYSIRVLSVTRFAALE